MKTVLLSLAAIFVLVSAKAQYSQNFEGTDADLTGNCWTMTNVHVSNSNPITGAGSILTQPLTGNSVKELSTPALNITSGSITVSFNYQLVNSLNGNSGRLLEVGLVSPSGAFTLLDTLQFNNGSSTNVVSYSKTFSVSNGWTKFSLRASGWQGPGTARLRFDDLSVDANTLYGIVGPGLCNSAPVVVDDIYNALIGATVSGNLMSNDSDPNGESMTAAVVANSPDGTLVLNPNGSFVFTPNVGFTGPVATFTYQLTDSGFDPFSSNVGLVTINFSAVGSLPVTLVSFTAALNSSNEVDIKWTTSWEKNVSHFAIERSTDGENYSQIGLVFAAGNSSDLMNYSFTDKKLDANNKTFYYRLRSVDLDASFELSAIRTVTVGSQNRAGVAISTYPNPVNSQLKITLPSNWHRKQVTFQVISQSGQVVKRSISGSANQMETVDVTSIAPGIYILSAICNGETAIQKIIKK